MTPLSDGVRFQVHQDLLQKNGWADLRAVSLLLPPCACCRQDSEVGREEHQTGTASAARAGASTARCGNTAHGIAGTVRDEESSGDGDGDGDVPEAGFAKVVFAVNAGCPIPTRRLVLAGLLICVARMTHPSRQR